MMGNKDGNRKIYWEAWKSLYKRKRDSDIGFRNFSYFNVSSSCKTEDGELSVYFEDTLSNDTSSKGATQLSFDFAETFASYLKDHILSQTWCLSCRTYILISS